MQNFVRKVASSIAVSPPPTTTTSLPRKKKPSQVAQAETPYPRSFCLALEAEVLRRGARGHDDGVGRDRAARLERQGERPRRHVDVRDRVDDDLRAEPLGLLAGDVHERGPLDAVLEAGEVLDVGRRRELAAGLDPLDDERLEVRARGVDRRGQTRGARPDDRDLVVRSLRACADDYFTCGEVLLRLLPVGLHGLRAGLPVGGADLAVLAHELERLQDAERLVHRAADADVVDRGVLDDAVGVDDEEAAQRDGAGLVEDAVLLGELLLEVLEERVREALDAALFPRLLGPREMAVLGVDGGAEHLGADLPELAEPVGEREDLGRADEREVEGVEEQDDPLPLVVGEAVGVRSFPFRTPSRANSGALRPTIWGMEILLRARSCFCGTGPPRRLVV